MAVFAGEAVNLVFNTRAIARANAFDHPGEHGRAVQAGADDVVGAGVGVRDPARHLARMHVCAAKKGEHRGRIVAGLLRERRKINRGAVEARWRAGFETTLGEFQFFEARAERFGRRVARAPGFVMVEANVDQARQKGACRQHHGAALESDAKLGHGTGDALLAADSLDQQVIASLLEQREIGLVFEPGADRLFVQHAVGLGAGGAHRRAFA